MSTEDESEGTIGGKAHIEGIRSKAGENTAQRFKL